MGYPTNQDFERAHERPAPPTYERDGTATATRRVINEVIKERTRQDRKWGEQNHAIPEWLAILMEEVGEASQAYLAIRFGSEKHGGKTGSPVDGYREELVQVAAVAVAAVEALDRGSR